MKTVMEQLIEIQDKLDALKAQEQGNNQVTLTNRTVVERTFTEKQVVEIAIELVRRTVDVCKEAVTNTRLEDGDFISLELNYNNQIETTLNSDDIAGCMVSEIDDYVNVDSDSITDEIGNIIKYLNIEC
jgi:predicted secreted protein